MFLILTDSLLCLPRLEEILPENDGEEARLEEILPENDGEGGEEILQEVERGVEGNQEGGSEGILTEGPQVQNKDQAQPKFRIPTLGPTGYGAWIPAYHHLWLRELF